MPLRVNLLLRLRSFFRSLLESLSVEVAMMARDVRSTLGSNLQVLRMETGLNPWAATHGQVKAALLAGSRVETPVRDFWWLLF